MQYATHRSLSNSPEWRAIILAAMLNDGLKTRVISEVDSLTAADLVDTVPVGSVEFCAAVAQVQGIVMPSPLDYPVPLRAYLGRIVRQGTLGESAGFFTKPVQTKAFEAFLAPACVDAFNRMVVDRKLDPQTPCWISEPITFVHEWRVYVEHHSVLGIAQYDLGEMDAEMSELDLGIVREMIEAWDEAPSAYALDVGLTDRGVLVLVEWMAGERDFTRAGVLGQSTSRGGVPRVGWKWQGNHEGGP